MSARRGAHHRHVAGVIAHAVLLLVGGVVLLIDDDQAEIGIGQEQRRARADHDRDVAGRDRRPGARPQALRELRMPFRRPHAEALGEAVEELRGQRDLRHQDQRLPAAPDGLRHRLEIDLGLAGAGDAVEQRRRIAAVGDGRAQAHPPPRAAPRESRAARKSGSGARATGSGGSTSVSSVPSSTRPSITPAETPASSRDLAFAARQAVGAAAPARGCAPRHALGRRAGEPHADALARGAEMLAHAQRHAQHHAARR